MKNDPVSKEYSKLTADTCKLNNISYEYIDAIENLTCDTAFEKVGVEKHQDYTNTSRNCCCHASHIKCWKRVIELKRPCLILEHDAVIKGNINTIEIPDNTIVVYGHRVYDLNDYTPPGPPSNLIQIRRAIGTHAYGITPVTAELLWDYVHTNKITVGIDRFLMRGRDHGLSLCVCEPPQVVAWVRQSTIDFSDRSKRNRAMYKNTRESITPGWLKGYTGVMLYK